MRQAARLHLTTDMSVDDIALQLGVADSTVYSWFDKMNISTKAPAQVDVPPVAAAPSESSKYDPDDKELQQYKMQGHAQAARDTFFRVICALYWGEGCLGDMDDLESTSEVSIASSDYSLINLWLKWLQTSDFNSDKVIRVHINRNNPSSEDAVRQFWASKLRTSSLSDTDIDVIRLQSATKKVTKKQKNGSAYVTVYDYKLRALILGGISYLKALSTKH